jgi:repressor LexA
MARKRKGLGERHHKILGVLERFADQNGYPPSIREIGKRTNISSTSVVNYYLDQLEEDGFIERDRNVSRGVRLIRRATGEIYAQTQPLADKLRSTIEDVMRIPIVGRIYASAPVPVPSSDFPYFDEEHMVEVARNMIPQRDKEDLFALEVQGNSMIDAMVNDGDIVIMKRAVDAQNGEMVAVWLDDKDETTLKYFYKEKGRVRLQPANPTMEPIYINNPRSLRIQGKVVMVIRQVDQRVN